MTCKTRTRKITTRWSYCSCSRRGYLFQILFIMKNNLGKRETNPDKTTSCRWWESEMERADRRGAEGNLHI